MTETRHVIFHLPGPAWVPGKSLFEQAGVRDHVDHYRKLLVHEKLFMGGPFLDGGGGGMMIAAEGASEQELLEFAQADPAVKSGLLVAELRPWLVGMKSKALDEEQGRPVA